MDRIGSSGTRRNFTQRNLNRWDLTRTKRRAAITAAIEPLEARQLLSVASVGSLPDVLANTATPSSNTVGLASYLADSTVPGTVADFTFYSPEPIFAGHAHSATVQVALTDGATPITVANFLNYANHGDYDGTFLHRAVDIASGSGGSPSDPATIVQGGGYYVNQANPAVPTIAQIATNAAIVNEAATESFGNVAGTIAMARTSDVNSATSQWFFNSSDNTDLDESTSNSDTSDTTGYCVFGKVLGSGLSVLTTLAKLPTGTVNSKLGLTTVPLAGVSTADAAIAKAPLSARNLVYVKSVTTEVPVTYTATSSNPSLVTPIVTGNKLSFRYGGAGGVAVVTVTANDSYDGSTASQSFHVTVPAAGSTATTPVTPADTAATTAGVAVTINPAANDYDGVSPINTSTLAITTQPTSGTAAVNAAAGNILYTPAAGFTGTDTLTYSISDFAGNSSTGTVTVNIKAAPATVSLNGTTARSLQYTQPDGAVSLVRVSGGTAVVTFAGSNVTTRTAGGTVLATGSDATIADIVITNAAKKQATLNISTSKGTDTIGGISDSGAMNAIVAPGSALIGNVSVGGTLGLLRVASADEAVISIGGAAADRTTVDLPTATDTSLASASTLAALRSTSWTATGTGAYTVSAPGIDLLGVKNAFADALAITGGALQTAKVGGEASESWDVTGTVGAATVGSAGTGWGITASGTVSSLKVRRGGLSGAVIAGGIQSLNVTGDVTGGVVSTAGLGTINVRGDLTSEISATTIKTVAVTGALSGSSITTSGSTNTVTTQLGRLRVGGAITGETVTVAGSIGNVSAASMSGSSLYAGVTAAISAAGTFPATLSDFAAAAEIRSVRLSPSAATAFSNSKVFAETLSRLSLGKIQNSNGGVSEGVAGQHILSLTGKLAGGGTLALSRKQLASAATLSSFLTKKKIALSDFTIDIVVAASSSSS